ncbi:MULTISPECIES: N-acetyltransferase [unclassified Fusibacter]|uniref:GNAT family N-acetyltransferase n=1 Tax=unclassified Fusibacter TaxID=2624464 RepID=UPI001010289F|nr:MULTISPECIES: GNAT family N-acetyltransferase [unclassified Fusibacter]MCK8058487.1 GNAT family N-acetyltransferase [Fusibacter sp. A2]NPE22744.1 GNAT family N-acetyltransferase [Fusibacter sp. A1]RXV60303.1 GNAT family N-acetyltransferase [Fusibacter sp. A1]
MIIELTKENEHLFNTVISEVKVREKLVPSLLGGIFTYHLEPVAPTIKTYSPIKLDLENYYKNENSVVYLYVEADEAIGQIHVNKSWNGYCYIDDIRVSPKHKGKGVGKALFTKAKEWGKAHQLNHMTLETQDVNVAANLFYEKMGMRIGAVDLMMYKNIEATKNEVAIFWFLMD